MLNGETKTWKEWLRQLFGSIDWALFSVFGALYEIFFDAALLEFVSDDMVSKFFGRVQLIIGVFMLFELTIAVLKAIVDPDFIADKKAGFSSIIKRVVLSLSMLALLVPVNIPGLEDKAGDRNYEFQLSIHNNGILFGTLYSLQWRVLDQNTLGKLILGSDNEKFSTTNGNAQKDGMQKIGQTFSSRILSGFMRFNTEACTSDQTLNGRNPTDVDNLRIEDFTDNLTEKCGSQYKIIYYPIISSIVAVIFILVIIGFTVDIVIRAVKLSLLRLLAPIPIISYMKPNQEKNNAFSNWVKSLTVTYLDLFLRLAILYFVIYIIQDFGEKLYTDPGSLGFGGYATSTGGMDFFRTAILYVLICYGLFRFAKMAVPFISQALGLQGMMQNVGLSTIFGGTAMMGGGFATGAAAAKQEGRSRLLGGLRGAAGAFLQGAQIGGDTATEAIAQGKNVSVQQVRSQNKDLMAKIRTGDKDAHGGLSGYVLDRLNYSNRELRARSLGIGRNVYAAADYEAKQLEKQVKEDTKALQTITGELASMQGVGGDKMAFEEWKNKMGISSTTPKLGKEAWLKTMGYDSNTVYGNYTADDLYNQYSRNYDNNVQEIKDRYAEYENTYNEKLAKFYTAKANLDDLEVRAAKAGSAVKNMNDARIGLQVVPRASDVWSGTYRSPRAIKKGEGVNKDIAVDENGIPILARDANGNVINGRARITGDKDEMREVRSHYQQVYDPKSFDGTIDDTYGSNN